MKLSKWVGGDLELNKKMLGLLIACIIVGVVVRYWTPISVASVGVLLLVVCCVVSYMHSKRVQADVMHLLRVAYMLKFATDEKYHQVESEIQQLHKNDSFRLSTMWALLVGFTLTASGVWFSGIALGLILYTLFSLKITEDQADDLIIFARGSDQVLEDEVED